MKPQASAPLGARAGSRTASSHVDDPRVVEALEEYLGLLKHGRRPSRSEFLARHSAIAEELADCLDGLDFVQSAASSLPSMEVPELPEETLGASTRLGDYRIVREVGRGGMGIVYEAEQVSLGRRVALKVLPFASAIDRRHRQRFQVEAQAAAQLQHAHIVPIYGVGTDRGIHYYAMQFIEGRTVALLIHELQKPGVSFESALSSEAPDPANEPTTHYYPPRASLETPPTVSSQRGRSFFLTVAELGRQAAEALEHAHSLGVLHRDIKPANLMVDLSGHLWITDFGLARISDDVGVTRTGDVLGTLRYMSPEQALGRTVVIDERTDVYSLGVTLYELMTMRPAFCASDRHVLLHQVANCEPVSPSKIDRSIPRDLETIVLKAMAKDPIGRYSSARALADDLIRFLEDKPILARRPNLVEQGIKWSRRHRPVVATALLLGMLGLPTATTLIWLEKGQTEKALTEVRAQRERDRGILRINFAMADEMTMRALETVTSVNQSGSYDFYRKSLEFYEKLAAKAGDDSELRSMKAQMYHRIGLARMMLGQATAGTAYNQSLRIFETLRAEKPKDAEITEQMSALLYDFGYMHLRYGRSELAGRMITRAIEVYRESILSSPDEPQLLMGLAQLRLRWASMLDLERRQNEAQALREEIYRDHQFLVEHLSLNASQRRACSARFFEQAIQAQTHGNRSETLFYDRLGLVVDPENLVLVNNLAWAYVCTSEVTQDEASEALLLIERVLLRFPTEWRYLHTKGVALFRLGRLDDAIMVLNQSMLSRSGGDPNEWFFLAMAEFRLGNSEVAINWYNKAVHWLEQSGMKDLEIVRFRCETEATLGIKPEPQPTRPSARAAAPPKIDEERACNIGGQILDPDDQANLLPHKQPDAPKACLNCPPFLRSFDPLPVTPSS